MAIQVNVDNFAAAETARMFDEFVALWGGSNRWGHFREPPSVDVQPVIRMNRDTLYSAAIVDVSQGASVTLPDSGDRYMAMTVIDEGGYTERVISEPGTYELTAYEFGGDFVGVGVRTFVDPDDQSDISAVHRLQDQLVVETGSSRPYEHPEYDQASLDATRDALLRLAEGVTDTRGMFGSRSDVDPVRYLLGSASGWGGLPESEAYYYLITEPRPSGRYTLTLADVPVDAFWSITIYNRDGYLEPNPYDSYSFNSVTAEAEPDGSVVLNLAPDGDGLRNHLYVMDGWNYALRLYRPRPEVLDGSWTPPTPQPVT